MYQYYFLFLLAWVYPSGHLEGDKEQLAKGRRRSRKSQQASINDALHEVCFWERLLSDLMEQGRCLLELPVTKQVVYDVIGAMRLIHIVRHLF